MPIITQDQAGNSKTLAIMIGAKAFRASAMPVARPAFLLTFLNTFAAPGFELPVFRGSMPPNIRLKNRANGMQPDRYALKMRIVVDIAEFTASDYIRPNGGLHQG